MNMINRCVNANDEVCKFPDCKCTEAVFTGVLVPKENEMPIQFVEPEQSAFTRWVFQRFGVAK
jgi:hypothetical protein